MKNFVYQKENEGLKEANENQQTEIHKLQESLEHLKKTEASLK